MMGMRMPETCRALFKRQAINLRSCCIWLVDSVESMMMHGHANPKFENTEAFSSELTENIRSPYQESFSNNFRGKKF
jgi:hypothetical protein